MEILNHIHIFKTNIEKENLPFVQNLFSTMHGILQWNVDIGDCDHVLRIVSYEHSESEIIEIVSNHGFHCEELS